MSIGTKCGRIPMSFAATSVSSDFVLWSEPHGKCVNVQPVAAPTAQLPIPAHALGIARHPHDSLCGVCESSLPVAVLLIQVFISLLAPCVAVTTAVLMTGWRGFVRIPCPGTV